MLSATHVDVDDLPKHERVAHALEQVNGLRYRESNRVVLVGFRGAVAQRQKKNINDDSDESDLTDDDDEDDKQRADAKPRRWDPQPLTLDEHIEHMLLRTRTIALLKIADNSAQVLADEDKDEDDNEEEEEEEEEFDNEEPYAVNEQSDRFDSGERDRPSPREGHSLSMRRMSSKSFRTVSFRSADTSSSDPEKLAALRLVRRLSTFLSLPKVISYKDLEEITESLLDEPHDESDEYAHLIDEHVDSARDSSSGDGSLAVDGAPQHSSSVRALSIRRMASQKSLRDLHVGEDPADLDLQQRRLYVANASLVRPSSKRLLNVSSSSLLRGASQRSVSSPSNSYRVGSMRQLGASAHDLVARKESKRSLHRGESWRSGDAGSIAEEADGKDDNDDDDDQAHDSLPITMEGGVLGTTFDEHGYKQWRTEIKDDYLAWIRAKVEAKKQRRAQRRKDAGAKPRWQLLYEAASKGGARQASVAEAMPPERQASLASPLPRGAGRKSVL